VITRHSLSVVAEEEHQSIPASQPLLLLRPLDGLTQHCVHVSDFAAHLRMLDSKAVADVVDPKEVPDNYRPLVMRKLSCL
jgi:hypothetical protein